MLRFPVCRLRVHLLRRRWVKVAGKHLVLSDTDRNLFVVEKIQVVDGAMVGVACPCRHCWRGVFREMLHSTKYFHIYAVGFCWRLRLQLWYRRQSFVTDIIWCINTFVPTWLMVAWSHADFYDYDVDSFCVSNNKKRTIAPPLDTAGHQECRLRIFTSTRRHCFTQKYFWFDVDLNRVTGATYFGKLAWEWNDLKRHNFQVPNNTKSHGPLKFPVKKQKLKWMTATTNCVYADDSDPFINVSINVVSILVIVIS